MTMEKNPISFLQEYLMSKRKTLPNYIVISEKKGTHINSFTIRVECCGQQADGTGSSKKEAKTDAATKMLKLLHLNQDNRVLVNKQQISSSSLNNFTNCSDNLDPEFTKSASYTNYVGKLQEFIVHKNLPAPVYDCTNVFGPSHLPKFTVSCKYDNMEEIGCGSTKKLAKNAAAKKMFESISTAVEIVVPEMKIESYLESMNNGISQLKIYKEQTAMQQHSAQRAKEKYPQLSKNKLVAQSTTSNRLCKDYHTLLTDAFSFPVRKLAIDQLKVIIDSCNKKVLLDNSFNKVKMVLETLNIKLTEIVLSGKGGTHPVLCGLQLDTNPIIFEISFGNDYLEAKKIATFKLAETLAIMLGD